jgi:hypothetical protein
MSEIHDAISNLSIADLSKHVLNPSCDLTK